MKVFCQILPLSLLLVSLNLSAQDISETYVASSVLSTGRWFKMAIPEDGVYRLDFEGLKQLGLENPSNPVIFGNNSGQLSFYNDGTAPDDLKEIAVYTSTGNDLIFNEGDYLLFYGQGTGRWTFNEAYGEYDYKKHYYSDTAYYFITSRPSGGKKVRAASAGLQATNSSSVSDALYVHEIDAENLIKSGREWYQQMTSVKDTEIDPGFNDVIVSEPMKYSLRVLARSSAPTSFRLSVDGLLLEDIAVAGVNLSSSTGTFAQAAKITGDALPPSSAPVFTLRFLNNGDISAKAWIDYFTVHARKLNTFNGRTTFYTDSKSVAPGIVTEFTIKSSANDIVIWDVSDPVNVRSVPFVKSGEDIKFRSATDTLRTFVAFVPGNAGRPVIYPQGTANQDLHSSPSTDMIIVTHPLFSNYAVKLAALHNRNSGLKSLIVNPQQIYNEFSGGIPDINAIRNFLRMKFLRQKDSDHPLKYLLLFGDGSIENKSSPPGNPNFIPTWQSQNSNIVISSFSSDDFYGLLEDGEGEDSGTEDIGIGRLPVSDTIQAGIIVSKITRYIDPSNQGDWKNNVCIIADDEDGNTHMSDAEGLADLLRDSVPWINVDKIYFDAYTQTTSATGQFYPGVSNAINDRINSGTLICNYIGHGNENSLGHERVLTTVNIDIWKNKARLPLFITATCEFSRFDDIEINIVTGEIAGRSSAGEKILFKQDGGGIALMSTTRLVYSAPNYLLNRNIFDVAFERDQEGYAMRLGDIIRIAKNRSGSGTNKRNFVLLGDPAVRLSYAWHGNVVTDSINNVSVNESPDTLKALSTVTVTGHIEDLHGNRVTGFDGIVAPVVYDKPSVIETLANDGGQKMKFSIQNNVLFNGKTVARDGKFRFTFTVPRDIDYNYGNGKISYYASDQYGDMKGVFSGIVAGGFSNNTGNDTSGPEIKLYINDTLFRDGGITDTNPRLYAIIEDPGGINTTGKALGHDLICWLDNDRDNYIVLNGFFEHDLGSSVRGRVIYDFSGLVQGSHKLTLKAWDNYNNSAENSVVFRVEPGEDFVLKNLMNFPNPFYDNTRISVEHNRPDGVLYTMIKIFSLNGRLIRILETTGSATGYQLAPVTWDGKDSNGARVGRGIYPYVVRIGTENGETATISGRMIIY